MAWRYEAATCWTWSAMLCASVAPSQWHMDHLAHLPALPRSGTLTPAWNWWGTDGAGPKYTAALLPPCMRAPTTKATMTMTIWRTCSRSRRWRVFRWMTKRWGRRRPRLDGMGRQRRRVAMMTTMTITTAASRGRTPIRRQPAAT